MFITSTLFSVVANENDAVVAYEAVATLFEPNGPYTFDPVINDAVWAFTAHEDVPNKEPVIPFETIREFKIASEPLTMTFFQLGILKFIMIGYRIAGPLPYIGFII